MKVPLRRRKEGGKGGKEEKRGEREEGRLGGKQRKIKIKTNRKKSKDIIPGIGEGAMKEMFFRIRVCLNFSNYPYKQKPTLLI